MYKKFLTCILAFCLVFSTIDLSLFIDNPLKIAHAEKEEPEEVESQDIVEKIREVEDLRESNTKTFINSDGSYTTDIYTEDIHFEDNGKLESISNTPEANSEPDKKEFKYKNKDNRFSVKFATNSKKKNLLKIKLDEEEVRFKLLNAYDVKAKKQDGLIIYEDILKNVDLEYSIGNSNVKEDIFLKSKDADRVIKFQISGSLTPKKVERNIHFYNDKNELIWIMPHPFMEDNNGKYSEKIGFLLKENEKGFILTLKPDEAFLEAKDTEYPVRIDPTVNLGNSSNTTQDTYVMQKYPNYNYYLTPELRTGFTDSTGITRSYIDFSESLPNLNGKLLVKAELKMYKWNDSASAVSTNVYANRITQAWNSQTVNYGKQPSFNTTVSYGSTSATGASGWRNMNVTDLVRDWMNGTYPNYGVVLRSTTEGKAGTYRKFNASETASNKPYLSITYSEKPAKPTATASSNANGTGYVNLTWPKVDGATGYKVLVFNGRTYEEFDAGNVTSWSTSGKKLWPTRTQIDNKQYSLRKNKDGRELPENPNDLYKRGGGDYSTRTNYWFRIKAYNKHGTTAQSDAAVPTIPDKTKPTVPTAVQITNDRIENFTFGWQPASDLDGSGVAKYKVYLGDQPNTPNIVNGAETTSQFYTHKGTLQPRKKYYAWVQAVDKSGNISGNSVPVNKEARKEFDAQIQSYYIPTTSDIDNINGENLWFDVQNTGTASWTNDSNINLSVTSTTPDGSPPVGFVGYLNKGEVIKPTQVKRFHVNWKPKEGVTGSYGIKAVVGKGTTPTFINPVENIVNVEIDSQDTTPPTGSFLINGGAKYTTNPKVLLKVFDVFDNANGEKYTQFANGKEGATEDQLTFSPTQLVPQSTALFDWKLEDREGTHYVYTRFTDASGNVSEMQQDTIVYDKTLPTIVVLNVNNGDFISGIKNIEGSITDDQESITYRIEYSNTLNEEVDWKLIGEGSTAVTEGVLAEWDTSNLPKGEYDIRISATDEAGQTNLETRTVWIDNLDRDWIGAESYYPMYPINLTDGDGFVNLYNGSVNIQDTDFSLNARGFSIVMQRTYSSNRTSTGMLGKGWISSFEEKLVVQDNFVDYTDPDGTIHRFQKEANGKFSIPSGTSYKLTYTDAKGYELMQVNGSTVVAHFEKNGLLKELTDSNGNELKYSYEDSLLKKVVSSNKSMTLQYNSDKTLSDATFSTGEKITFTYKDDFVTDVKLLTKSGKVNRHIQYGYNNEKLQTIVSKNGLTIEFEYNGDRMVQTKSQRTTRVINGEKKYPLKTFDSIIETMHYDLNTNKIIATTNSINPNKTSTNLANTEYELNANGNVLHERVIRTYMQNENPEDANQDENNMTVSTEYVGNRLISSTDALGNKTTNSYDDYGNILQVTLPGVKQNGSKNTYSLQNVYNEKGQVTQTKNRLGHVKKWIYDKKWNPIEVVDEEGNRQNYEYDAFGNITKTKSDRGPLYGYLADYSMEEKDLVKWNTQGTVKKVTTQSKSGKQSTEIAGNGVLQSDKVAIKKGRLPVQAFLDVKSIGTGSLEFKLQFLNVDNVIKEYTENLSPTNAWSKARVNGAVPTDATHVRIQVTNKGGSALYVDDWVLEETGLESKYVYDSEGENVLEVTDPYGDKTKYSYNEYGLPLTEKNPLGQTKTIAYDEMLQTKQVKDAKGHTTKYDYDQMGNVIEEVNSLGQSTTYEYNEWNQLLYTKLPSVKNTYYRNESVDKTEEEQAHLYIEYDELGRTVKETDEKGNPLAQEYDGYGRIARTIDPMQNQKYFAYDQGGNVIHTVDYAAKSIDDGNDKVLIAKGEMYATYDEWNRQITETDNTGNRNVLTTTNTYDAEDRLIHTKDAEGTELFYTFNNAGENLYIKDNSTPVVETWTYYDGLGTPAITLSGNALEYAVTDANGNVLQTIDHKGTKTTFVYNAAGDKTKQTNPDGSTVEWTYNEVGQPLTETQKVEETDTTTTHLTTHYEYNDAGEVIKQKLDGKVYDKQSKDTVTVLIKETELTYDELGRLIRELSKHYEEGTTTFKKSDVRFLYDINGNLIRKWIYDESSQTINQHDEKALPFVRSESIYEYDANNRFTREEKTENNMVTVKTYKDDENAEEIQSALGKTTVYYNENDLASKIITPLSEQYLFTYTATELKDKISGPRLTVDMDYGLNEKMTGIKTLKKDTTDTLFSETYGYNGEEQIVSATNEWDGAKSYTYTAEGFLKTVKKGSETLTYSYDVNGNLLKAIDQTGKVRVENQYGQGNRINSSLRYNADTKKYYKVSYKFRADGSLEKESIHIAADTVDGAKAAKVDHDKLYDYASINLLTSITTKKGSKIVEKIEFTYDSEDNRTSKRVTNDNGERLEFYYYDANGDLVSISEKSGIDVVENKMNIYRDSDGQLLSFEHKGKLYDYIYNQRGDIVAISNELKEIVARYTYDEWGNQLQVTSTSALGKEVAEANPFRYVGKFGVMYDEDTKLYFMGWRDYDATIGRFHVADEYEGEDENPISFNRYLYAESDPVNNIDPDGYAPKWLKKIAKGVKKAAKSSYNFLIGDDIRTLKSKKTKWYQKAGAAVSIASNFVPGGGVVTKVAKGVVKGTSKSVKTAKVATKRKVIKAPAKKVAAKVNKPRKTVPAKSIKSTPKNQSPAPAKVRKVTAKPKSKTAVAQKPARVPPPIRLDLQFFAKGTEKPKYVPKDTNGEKLGLPRNKDGKMVNGTSHIPESMNPHTQIGIKKGRKGEYFQTLEWGRNWKPIQRTDWTDHGRGDHVNPHSHPAIFKDGSWSFKE